METKEKAIFRVQKNDLLSALEVTKPALTPIRGRGVLCPTSDYVLTICEDNLTVETYNGLLLIRKSVHAVNTGTLLSTFSLDRKILKAVRLLDEQELEFELFEYQIAVRHNKGSFLFPLTNDADDYEMFHRTEKRFGENRQKRMFTIESPCLLSVMNRCKFAMAIDMLRPVMSGVCIDMQNNYTNFVASDGHKLVRIRKDSLTQEEPVKLLIDMLIVNVLLRTLPKTGFVNVEYTDDFACRFKIDEHGLEFVFKLTDGRYPNYNSVYPEHYIHSITVDRTEFMKSIRRLSLFTNQSKVFKMDVRDGGIHLSAEDYDFSIGANETVPCDYHDEPFMIAFQADYFADSLKNLGPSKNVIINYSGSNRATILVPTEQPAHETVDILLMPMLINDYTNERE